jgi:hypothetical protein
MNNQESKFKFKQFRRATTMKTKFTRPIVTMSEPIPTYPGPGGWDSPGPSAPEDEGDDE